MNFIYLKYPRRWISFYRGKYRVHTCYDKCPHSIEWSFFVNCSLEMDINRSWSQICKIRLFENVDLWKWKFWGGSNPSLLHGLVSICIRTNCRTSMKETFSDNLIYLGASSLVLLSSSASLPWCFLLNMLKNLIGILFWPPLEYHQP